MSLEQKIEALTAAIEANTAALQAAGGAAPKADKPAAAPKADKPAKVEKPAAYEAKHTKTEASAAIEEVKTKLGVPKAKGIIKELGFEKLSEIVKPEDIDKLYDAAKEALGGGEGGGDDDI